MLCSTPLFVASTLVSALGAATQAEPRPARADDRLPLHVTYVGNADTPRARAHLDFLRRHFAGATAVPRGSFTGPGDADVVLLDWSQSDVDIMKMAAIESPLGRREDWKTPLVLLGSAGLLLATPWELIGSYG